MSLFKKFPFLKQNSAMDCGPTCLSMIVSYYGKFYNIETLRELSGQSKTGTSLLSLSEAGESIGFRTRGAHLTYKELSEEAVLPCILHWNQDHYAVAIDFPKNQSKIKIADPAKGILTLTKKEFLEHWVSSEYADSDPVGTVLLMEPSAAFYQRESDKQTGMNWRWILTYLKKGKLELLQILSLLLIVSVLQLIFPFITQSVIDTGIANKNLSFITILLIAQLVLVFSTNMGEFIRSRMLLQVSAILNLSILSDFWIKLTRLPLSYFTRNQLGDTLQRIDDHKQIESFLTGSALSTFFSTFNFIVYAIVLALYNPSLFLVFGIGSIIYLVWIQLFLRIMRKINYQNFFLGSKENNATMQLVEGMQEIRLNNAEQIKRWEWENIQARIFKLSFKQHSYSQVQQVGATMINQGKDIVITFIVANLVIKGELTLGAMFAIQYIIGQLSGPVEQMIGFIKQGQEAKISLERLNEVHQLPDEESKAGLKMSGLPARAQINIQDLSFTYPGSHDPVFTNLNLSIPAGKTTAIVGSSGSGKTTLLKLLLKFYNNYTGQIRIKNEDIADLSSAQWRKLVGTVMQDGFVFNDTLARNIAVTEQSPDPERLKRACTMANILEFIEDLPNGFNTKLGSDGQGISQGQKQRILIARAIYKNPDYLFFDEATNALDANNEKSIVANLNKFFHGRTVVVVAHRLSTVKNADKIVVLEHGAIIEEGTHEELTELKGRYYHLVKDQLELGS
ncbi:MAG: peptidase domain-containing ABC transporter [Roseivirga sp.]